MLLKSWKVSLPQLLGEFSGEAEFDMNIGLFRDLFANLEYMLKFLGKYESIEPYAAKLVSVKWANAMFTTRHPAGPVPIRMVFFASISTRAPTSLHCSKTYAALIGVLGSYPLLCLY